MNDEEKKLLAAFMLMNNTNFDLAEAARFIELLLQIARAELVAYVDPTVARVEFLLSKTETDE